MEWFWMYFEGWQSMSFSHLGRGPTQRTHVEDTTETVDQALVRNVKKTRPSSGRSVRATGFTKVFVILSNSVSEG